MKERTMAETKVKPFWVEDAEWAKKGLPKLEGNVAEAVVSGVPELKWVEKGSLIGAHVQKDGMLVYHFYKKDRKAIYDEAQTLLEASRGQPSEAQVQQSIAERANADLEAHPWWPQFKEQLEVVFNEHFKYQPFKVDYYPEVDSWSVIMPVPDTPVPRTIAQLEAPFSVIALRVGG
jgi:hypothetical protein